MLMPMSLSRKPSLHVVTHHEGDIDHKFPLELKEYQFFVNLMQLEHLFFDSVTQRL
jgi:hypothetical protein